MFKNRSPLAKRMIIMIIALIIFFGLIFGYNGMRAYFMKQYFAHYAPPPVTISATKSIQKTWQPTISAVGTVVAVNGVDVTSQVSGMITKINFTSGQTVKAGDLLVNLDDSADLQDLKNYQAALTLAQLDYQRQVQLFKTNTTAQSTLDQARAQLQEAEANVAKTQVLISQKAIKAPFDGKIGISQIDLGQYISPGTALVSLQSLDPLYVQFTLPEQNIKSLYVDQPIELTVDAYGNEKFLGKISAINAKIDTQTHNILVEATVPNKDLRLYPGMFANVEVILPKQENVITVPQTAVTYNLYGDSIYIIKNEGKDKAGKPILRAYLNYVTTGARKGNEVAILKGITPGTEVVTSGQLKLQDGTQVIINNDVNLNNNNHYSNS